MGARASTIHQSRLRGHVFFAAAYCSNACRICVVECHPLRFMRPERWSLDGRQFSSLRQSSARSLNDGSAAACPGAECRSADRYRRPICGTESRASPRHRSGGTKSASPTHLAQRRVSNGDRKHLLPNNPPSSCARSRLASFQIQSGERSVRGWKVPRVRGAVQELS